MVALRTSNAALNRRARATPSLPPGRAFVVPMDAHATPLLWRTTDRVGDEAPPREGVTPARLGNWKRQAEASLDPSEIFPCMFEELPFPVSTGVGRLFQQAISGPKVIYLC